MHSLLQTVLPPSGVELAGVLNLNDRTLLVVARSNFIRVFSLNTSEEQQQQQQQQKLCLVRRHRVHGQVTGMSTVKIASSTEDKLLVSFKDSKLALLEWEEGIEDFVTVSIHTYERALVNTPTDATSSFVSLLRVDDESRCATLLLPHDQLAILPFVQHELDVDMLGPSTSTTPAHRSDIPYLPSFILSLPTSVDPLLQHVLDFSFLPGFTNPTLAVLCQPQQTWSGRLKEFKDTFKLVIFTLDLVTHRYPVISPVHGLPHDCIYIVACPANIGGVVVVSANALIYVDQTGRRVVLPVNGWLSRISDTSATSQPSGDLKLEGSRALFVDERTLHVVLVSGTIYPVKLVVEGKSVTRLELGPEPLAETTIPSVVARVGEAGIFVGSTVGPSVLLKREERVEHYEEEGQVNITQDVVMGGAERGTTAKEDADMDMDSDDDDIYGPSTKTVPTATQTTPSSSTSQPEKPQKKLATRITTSLALHDHIPDYGSLSSMSFSLTTNSGAASSEKHVPELICATGSGHLGGFTLFQRDLPCRVKRRLHAIGGARGIWSFSVKGGIGGAAGWDNVVISTDATPSPGLSRIASRSSKTDLAIDTRIPGTTVGAGPFFGASAILHVMTGSIRVLEPDGTERQVIKDVDSSSLPRARIRSTSILDPYVLIFREDDSIGLFVDTERGGRIRRKDMSPMGDKTSRYIAGTFFEDSSGLFEMIGGEAGVSNKWLLLVRPQGTVEIWSSPKLALVFSTPSLATLDTVILDSHDEPAKSLPPPEGGLRQPLPSDIEQVVVAPLGEGNAKNHLFVYLRNGQLAVYAILPWKSIDDVSNMPRSAGLGIRLVKVLSKTFETASISTPSSSPLTTSVNGQQDETNAQMTTPTTATVTTPLEQQQQQQKPFMNPMFEPAKPSSILEQKKAYRQLIPFATREKKGVFFTGDVPSWILASDKGGVNVYPAGYGVVHSFSCTTLWENDREFLIYSDEGPALIEWIPTFNLDHPLPARSIRCERPYSHVLFDPSTSLLVAASSLRSRFGSFDEDDQKVWSVDAPYISDPTVECSALELINADPWVVLDGYEFATNEFVNALERVSLETAGSESGQKEFIAVGTSIVRGEDLAVKGATYIFEITEVVPDRHVQPRRWYKLRLRYRDDAKGPVTALSGFNGYLVSSMGQKIFVRAFDSDERLVGIAFLDVGIYVTSLRTLKNLLLIGDAVKSVWFVAFQEDPYKLVILSKDVQRHCVTSVDFFFVGDQLAILAGDESGVMRVYAYDPTDPDSRNGQLLALRTEFNAQVEYRTSTLVARRAKEDGSIPQARLLLGHTDGSLSSLTSVDDRIAKRLQLLQGQLSRNVQHIAGLNPRAHRTVRNEHVSKPLTKGIFDGDLLETFQTLSETRQREITKPIGVEPGMLLKDWTTLVGVW